MLLSQEVHELTMFDFFLERLYRCKTFQDVLNLLEQPIFGSTIFTWHEFKSIFTEISQLAHRLQKERHFHWTDYNHLNEPAQEVFFALVQHLPEKKISFAQIKELADMVTRGMHSFEFDWLHYTITKHVQSGLISPVSITEIEDAGLLYIVLGWILKLVVKIDLFFDNIAAIRPTFAEICKVLRSFRNWDESTEEIVDSLLSHWYSIIDCSCWTHHTQVRQQLLEAMDWIRISEHNSIGKNMSDDDECYGYSSQDDDDIVVPHANEHAKESIAAIDGLIAIRCADSPYYDVASMLASLPEFERLRIYQQECPDSMFAVSIFMKTGEQYNASLDQMLDPKDAHWKSIKRQCNIAVPID